VDEDKPPKEHILYAGDEYSRQYHYRYDAAVRHIRQAFQLNWHPS
jgi:hypothetical protein